MALPLNRERPNRGGKPLVSVGINGGGGALWCCCSRPRHAVPRGFEAVRLIKNCPPNQLMRDFSCAGRFDSMGFGLVSFERVTVDSSIQVGVRGPTVWVKVEGKGSFLNSGNLKEFSREMLDRGYREFVVDLADCAMMDSTFMGTMASVTLFIAAIAVSNFFPGSDWIRYSISTAMAVVHLNVKRLNKPPEAIR